MSDNRVSGILLNPHHRKVLDSMRGKRFSINLTKAIAGQKDPEKS